MNFYEYPEVLLDGGTNYSELVFIHTISLGNSIKEIKLSGDEDIYYKGESINERLSVKFQSLLSTYGWVHFTNGTSFETQKGSAIGIKICNDSLGSLKSVNSKKIVSKMGEPDTVESDIDTWVFDSVHNANIYCYLKIGVNFHLEPVTDRIIEVRIYKPNNSLFKKFVLS